MLVANTPGSNLKSLMANLFPALVLDAKDYWKVLNVNKFKQLLEETGDTFEYLFVIHQFSGRPNQTGLN